jgi:hypothetical protein
LYYGSQETAKARKGAFDLIASESLWNFSHYAHVGTLEQELGLIRELGHGVELWGRWRDVEDLYSQARRAGLKAALNGMPVSLHSAIVHSFTEHQAQKGANGSTSNTIPFTGLSIQREPKELTTILSFLYRSRP